MKYRANVNKVGNRDTTEGINENPMLTVEKVK